MRPLRRPQRSLGPAERLRRMQRVGAVARGTDQLAALAAALPHGQRAPAGRARLAQRGSGTPRHGDVSRWRRQARAGARAGKSLILFAASPVAAILPVRLAASNQGRYRRSRRGHPQSPPQLPSCQRRGADRRGPRRARAPAHAGRRARASSHAPSMRRLLRPRAGWRWPSARGCRWRCGVSWSWASGKPSSRENPRLARRFQRRPAGQGFRNGGAAPRRAPQNLGPVGLRSPRAEAILVKVW